MKSDVLTLVETLSLGQADQALCSGYYDELVERLGREQPDLLLDVTLIESIEAGTAQIAYPTEAQEILAVFFGGRRLTPLARYEVSVIPNWRSRTGMPIGFVTDGEPDRTLRLYPIPDTDAEAFSFTHGEPLGIDHPGQTVAIIHTVNRQDLPSLFTLPMACDIVATEFTRESDHRDPNTASAFRALADALFAFVPGYVTRA